MKRHFGLAMMLIACLAMAGCSKTETDSSQAESTAETTAEVIEETVQETAGETPSAPEGQSIGQPIQEIPMTDEILMQLLIPAEHEESAVKSDATETDFIGNWECEVMRVGEYTYSGMFGVPFTATEHLTIAEKEGTVISIKAGAEPETTETAFTWELKDGAVNATLENGMNVVFYLDENGELSIHSKNSDGEDVVAHYQKVDSFSAFDFSSVDFSFESVLQMGDASDSSQKATDKEATEETEQESEEAESVEETTEKSEKTT